MLKVRGVTKIFNAKDKSRVVANDNGRFLSIGTPKEVKSSVSNLMRIELNLLTDKQKIRIPDWVVSSRRKEAYLFFSIEQSNILTAVEWASS